MSEPDPVEEHEHLSGPEPDLTPPEGWRSTPSPFATPQQPALPATGPPPATDAPYDAPTPGAVDPALVPTPPQETPWRRMDTRMLLVHPVNEVIRFLPVVTGIVFVGRAAGGWQLFGLLVPVVWGLWRFFTTSFRVTDSQVELKRGLVSRKVLTARLDRVRSVELTSSLLHRLLGLAKVRIGTGSAASISDDSGFELDALRGEDARVLRAQLLRQVDDAPAAGGADAVDGDARAPVTDRTLLELDVRWARYAPFTSAGAVVAAGVLALAGQALDAVGPGLGDLRLWEWLSEQRILPLAASVALLLAVLAAVFGVIGYLVTNWGFTLTRRTDGTSLRVSRGLLTTTETMLETERVRGVELVEPLGLRAIGAARLKAMIVGASMASGGTTTVAPNCPRDVALRTADGVLDTHVPFDVPLAQHGPVARRRRTFRALAVVPFTAAALAVPAWFGWFAWWSPALSLVLVPPMLLVARDRYRRLGHALTESHLVTRAGTFESEHVALDLDGVISWHVDQSFFQRRQGIATLVATTAAGSQHYDVVDLPLESAVALALSADRDLVGQFVSH